MVLGIVFILAGDLGFADVASYGRPDLRTPNAALAQPALDAVAIGERRCEAPNGHLSRPSAVPYFWRAPRPLGLAMSRLLPVMTTFVLTLRAVRPR